MLLALRLSWTRSNLTAWLFLRRLVRRYGHHPAYTDGALGTLKLVEA
ncbi:MAG: hypothetical protein QW057_02365 [Candidatus Bathyarchaeia archaeon]